MPPITPTAASIVSVFDRQVAAGADRVAVRAPDAELTYGQLRRRADALARRLCALGVGPEDPVAVGLPRSADLAVALLGVLRAGGCYVALDPEQPPSRHELVRRDAGVSVEVTAELVAEAAADVDTDTDTDPLSPPGGNERLAYIGYTSGSSGRPKGVCVPHRAVLRLVLDQDVLPVGPDDAVLQFAPVAFDASTWEIWGPLLNGGRVVIAPPGPLSPHELIDLVDREGVTALWLTAGLFHAVVEAGLGGLAGVRLLVAGGDVLSAAHVDRVRRELGGTRFVNGYGPTENTTFTTCHEVLEPVGDGQVPIGRPVRGTGVHVLDDRLQPVPDGTVGELCAAGLGLARGYRGDAAQTAATFLPNPFDGAGARLYRTGDLVRRRADGVLEFHGRVDDQVKIRGYRVEVGEVEAALRRLPEVLDVVVVAQGTGAERSLTAFYVSDSALVTRQLREDLGAVLPSYLVPSAFVRLDEVPLTANGKVDRAALAGRSVPERPELSTDFRAPSTSVETWLAALWSDLIQIAPIGVDDDFFELGGHSLMATRITVEITARHDRVVPVVAFYEDPTIARLAALIEHDAGEPDRRRDA